MAAVHAALPPKHDPFVDLVPRLGVRDDERLTTRAITPT
jgi:hypothetical protein